MPKFLDVTDPAAARAALGASTATHFNVKDYGAVGDGVADDTSAIEAAFAASGTSASIYLPAGNYVYNGSGLSSTSPRIIGSGLGTTITLGESSYLINTGILISGLLLRDLNIVGGKGVIKHTYTSSNVAGHFFVQNCRFYNYTECAIASDAEDMPYWHIRDCFFDAANTTGTIGIALGGQTDQCVIDACSFIRNRVHIKARTGGNNLQIKNTDFLQFSAVNSGGARTSVWIVPNVDAVNAGAGLSITGCKFGNENLVSGDYRILYADEQAGASNGVRFPELGADSAGYISGHLITGNLISNTSDDLFSVIYSTTPNVWDTQVHHNAISGGKPKYVLEYRTVPTARERFGNNVFGPFTGAISTESLPLKDSNGSNAGYWNDPQGYHQLSGTIRNWTSGSSSSYKSVLSTAITAFTASSGTKATITDAYNGSDAIKFTMSNSGANLYAPVSGLVVGMPLWIEFDVANPNDGNQASKFRVTVGTVSSFRWRRYIEVPSVDKGWVTYGFAFTPRTVEDGDYLQFQATGAAEAGKTVNIGRVRVYHANERQLGGQRPAIAAAATGVSGGIALANDVRNKMIGLGLVSGTPSSASVSAAVSELVFTSANGGNGAEDGANTWVKIADISFGAVQYVGGTLLLAVSSNGQQVALFGECVILAVHVTQNDSGGTYPPSIGVRMLSKSSSNNFAADSFKVISSGYNTPFQLWVRKTNPAGQVNAYEISRSGYSGMTVTYNATGAWQSAVPSGTTNASSAGVTVDGNAVSTRVAAPASATAAGKPGQWAADSSYIYTYTGDGTTHTWVRASAASW